MDRMAFFEVALPELTPFLDVCCSFLRQAPGQDLYLLLYAIFCDETDIFVL